MAQIAEEENAVKPNRSLLRSVTLIASCTGAMIVNVRLSPSAVRKLNQI